MSAATRFIFMAIVVVVVVIIAISNIIFKQHLLVVIALHRPLKLAQVNGPIIGAEVAASK